MSLIKSFFILIFVFIISSCGANITSNNTDGLDDTSDMSGSTETDNNVAVGTASLSLLSSDPNDIDWFTVDITASDMDTISETFDKSGDVEVVVYNIPVGVDRVFAVSAYDSSDTLLFEGSATTDIVEDTTVSVSITLVDMNATEENVGNADISVTYNLLPRIDYATATSNSVNTSETVDLTVTASDPDGDSLTYEWSSTCGSFSSTTSTSTTWTAPSSSGSCTVSILVEDGHDGEASLDIEMTVL